MASPALSPLFFVGGCFGAGKSTLCRELARLWPGEHLKASELIAFEADPSDLIRKVTDEALSNQERLVKAIEPLRSGGRTLLLDGHYCLLDSSHAIVPIPLHVFERLNPVATLLVETAPQAIVERLARRDGAKLNLELAADLAVAERTHAYVVAQAMEVPLLCVRNNDPPERIVESMRSLDGGRQP